MRRGTELSFSVGRVRADFPFVIWHLSFFICGCELMKRPKFVVTEMK
jgi:hypothetical protein